MKGLRPGGFSIRRLAASCFQTTTLLGCAAIIVGNLTLSAYFDHQRERALEDARTVARNLNTAFEQHVVRSIRNIDQMLLFARAEFQRDPAAFSPERLGKSDFFPKDMALQLAAIGPDGMMLASSLPSAGLIDLSDREHFRFHLEKAGDELFISKPLLGRVSKQWSVQFTRKLKDEKGQFAGVIVASLDPYFLSRIYESIDIGASGAVTLWGLDGIIRARGGVKADTIGHSLGSSNILQAVRDSSVGIYEAGSVLDGVQRIISYRRVPGYPLVVTVAMGRDEALAPFEASKETLLRIALLADFALLVLIGLGVAESYRLRSMREHLSAKSKILASTFANMKEGILLIDSAGMVIAVNDVALDLLGLSRRGLVMPTPYAQLSLARYETGFDAHDIQQIALGGGRTIEVKTSTLPDGGVVKTLNDISARKSAQSAIEEARDKAEAASRARTSFLATMSHEIRTPLGGILSMVDLIAATKLDPMQKRYVEITRDSATHLLQLIDDVLDVTKLDANHVAIENISFDLYRQIRSTLDIVSPRALEKGLSIGCVVAPDVPRTVMGDPGRLRQVLINLLGNAIKFTASGHVLVNVACASNDEGERLCVRVEDSGIGIAPDKIKNLFIDFSQIDSSITRRFGGTGLGLAISRKLVTRMGGTIGVESMAGVGSAFYFDIPMRAERCLEPIVAQPAALALVVHNAFERTNLIREVSGCFDQLETFESLDQAKEWAKTIPVNIRRIVLVDAALAPEDGGGASTSGKLAPEIFLIGLRQAMIPLEDATRRGYAGVLRKPIFPDDLRRMLATKPAQLSVSASDKRRSIAGLLAGYRVLIAEDNPINQFALGRMLETMGARVTAASNGLEAVEQAMKQQFDVVLMDVMMPELDGLAAARAIRGQAGPNAGAPIIALTASAFTEDREAALASGMNAFATKPITGHILFETIINCQVGVAALKEGDMSAEPMDDPAIDQKFLDQLREDLGPEHIGPALDMFLADLQKRVARLRAGDRSAIFLRKEAHALKGSAASFGFRRIAAAAAKLEDAARLNESEKFETLLEALLTEADGAPALLAA